MMLLPFDTIVRSIDFDERANEMQLRPWQWEFLLGVDGRTRLSDLARLCGIDFETAVDLVNETEALGLVEIVTLSLDGYRALAAQLVTPISIPLPTPSEPAAPSAPPALESASIASDVPRKAVSVSFDSFSSIMAEWDVPAAEPVEPVAPPMVHEIASDRDLFADRPAIDYAPIDFEFPNHMEPLAKHDGHVDSVFSESYGDLFATPDIEHVAEHHEPAHVATTDFMDYVPSAPSVAVAPSPEAPKKSVSFSLSADSFGLPGEPFDLPAHDARADAQLPEPTVAHVPMAVEPPHEEPKAKIDDVLLQHFQVAETPLAAPDAPAATGASEPRTSGDLTGTVLRVLGFKR